MAAMGAAAEVAEAGVDVLITLGWSGLLLAGAVVVYLVTRSVVLRFIRRGVRRSETTWDDQFVHRRVPRRLALVPSALLVALAVPAVPGLPDTAITVTQRVADAAIIVSFAAALFAALTAANDIYETQEYAAERPIKGYLQLVKIVVAIVAGVLVVATLANQSPLLLLSGLGAATAVLLLIFRDTILSLVASVQLATNDMIRVGDWIEMDELGADGDVVDIALHTVKVRNWDKTVVTIPTHRLISDSFKNWRGMQEAGGRRIKRAVPIDLTSVRFLTDDDLDRLATWPLLARYLTAKREELGVVEGGHDPADVGRLGARRLTNLGTFRAYCQAYLRDRDDLHVDDMTMLVRQMPAGPEGVAIELYVFTRTTAWAAYEAIQADLFDHLLAILPSFGLRPYQHPTSADVAGLARATPTV